MFVVLKFHISVLENVSCVDEKVSCVQLTDFGFGHKVSFVKISHSCVGKRFPVLKVHILMLAKNSAVKIPDFCVADDVCCVRISYFRVGKCFLC